MSLSVWLAIALLLFIPTLWAIINIAYKDLGSTRKKALWGLFVVFVPPVGGIVYLIYYLLKNRTMSRSSTEP